MTLGGVTVNLPGSYSGTISGAITGTGHLRFAPIFNGRPYSIATAPSPDLEATIASTVNVMVPWRINGALRVEASSLAVNANMDVGRLEVLRSYDWSTPSITIAAGATLRATDPVMYLNSASVIRGDLAGVERTIVSHVLVPRYGNSVPGFGLRTVDLTVATGLRGTLEIHEGAMILPATFEPGVPNLIDLRNAESASIYVSGEGDAADTIRLNNATGGGLIEQLTFGSAAASLDYAAMNAALSTISNHSYVGVAPRIELGNIGARVGGRLRLLGAVSGGALTTTYASGVELRSPANSYTGPTHVGASSTLSILGQGQIRSSPDIVFGPYGSLFLGAAGQAEDVDRIGDTASVRFASGGSLTAHVAPQATERVGTIELQAGSVYVSVPTAGSTLRGAGLARARGAVLVARDLSGALAFDTPPANMNGIVGGWAVDSGNRFLRYDPALGLRPADATSTDLLTAGPADYVRVPGGASLTLGSSDVNVHALDTQGATLNLNGRRLTVGSGGLSAGVISNGSIVPGNDSGRELFVHGSGTLSATVADGPLGPTDLVVRGSGSISNTRILEGTHTFSGGLVVSNGGLNIGTTGFIPSARFIDVSTAVLSIGPNPLPPLEHVTLKGGSIFGPQGQGAANPIRAGRYEIHSGQFFAALAGYGRVVKTTQASATLGPGGSSFDGPIDVEEGILVLDAGTRGVVTVHKGAGLTLSGSNSLYDNTIVLNGGILQSHNANVLAPLRVTADSSWQHNVRVPGGLQSFSGGLYIDAGATLSYRVPPSQFAWEISGEIIVDGAFRSAVGHQVISSTGGTIPMIPGPNLRLGGKGLIEAIALVGRGARVAPALDDVGRLTVLELHQDATGKFELNLVDALAGPGVGWDVLGVTRTATLGGTNPAGVAEVVLRSPPGGVANFDPNRVHAWRFIESLSGVLAGPVTVNASGLQGITLPAGARFSVEPYPDGLYVVYVPEPSALALAAVAAWAGRRRRDRFGEN